MTHILAIANQKGGVGKTTTAVNLAHGLALEGKRVLLVDWDSQGSATRALGLEPTPDTARLIVSGEPIGDLTKPARERLDILRSNDRLASVRDYLAVQATQTPAKARTALRTALEPALATYDMILIDCGPGLDQLVINALLAAQTLILPVSVDYLSAAGTRQQLDTLEAIGEDAAELLYVLPTMYDQRTKHAKKMLAMLERAFGPKLAPPIRINTRLREAAHVGQTIFEYDAGSYGAEDYQTLTQRVLNHD